MADLGELGRHIATMNPADRGRIAGEILGQAIQADSRRAVEAFLDQLGDSRHALEDVMTAPDTEYAGPRLKGEPATRPTPPEGREREEGRPGEAGSVPALEGI